VAFFDFDRPLVFAHRGGCALGPENTLAAFDLGLSAGADGLELDVHLSADGVVVVHHDPTLERCTDATGPIARRTAAELARVDAGNGFRSADGRSTFTGQGIGVPTLREVLRRFAGVPTIIEMKVDSEAMGRALVDEIRAADAVEWTCAAGFGCRATRAVRALLPELATSACRDEVRLALYRSWAGWPTRHAPFGGYQIPERSGIYRIVSPRFIAQAHRAGLKVQVWTVDEEPDMRRLLDWGVDALISNRPDLAVRVRDEVVCGTQA
jgi:glycerophosphoryl diester phosphodiesterase